MCQVTGEEVKELVNAQFELCLLFMEEGEEKERMKLALKMFNANWKPGVIWSHEKCNCRCG